MEAAISTYSQDCKRGLAHPDSVAARQQRIQRAQKSETERKAKLNQALQLIRESLSASESDVLLVLHATSSAFARHHGPTSYLHSVVTGLDELADSIEYPEAG